jgi:FMN phosphatase YigB (HAD superfamily)
MPTRGGTLTRAAQLDLVFLVDVDNTLLDNDAVIADLRAHLLAACGGDCERRYWDIFEQRRAELGYADYLGALQQYRFERPREPHVLDIALYLLDYPFATRVYPGALDAVRRLRSRAPVVILSDGDVVFQPRKVQRSGLWDAVEGRVLIYVHKEQMLEDVAERYPARHYVMVDDKVRILTAMKAVWGARLTTVFVRQGHYAVDEAQVAAYPAADVTLAHIADLSATIGG